MLFALEMDWQVSAAVTVYFVPVQVGFADVVVVLSAN